jgi:hypothetical protein
VSQPHGHASNQKVTHPNGETRSRVVEQPAESQRRGRVRQGGLLGGQAVGLAQQHGPLGVEAGGELVTFRAGGGTVI